jgi:hypothetical protein
VHRARNRNWSMDWRIESSSSRCVDVLARDFL